MARTDIPSGWDKIRLNVQETERLMGQKKYNQSMIKAKQTVEYMVKLQCDQAGIMESSMDSMIRELYNNGWIAKSTAEHYLQMGCGLGCFRCDHWCGGLLSSRLLRREDTDQDEQDDHEDDRDDKL